MGTHRLLLNLEKRLGLVLFLISVKMELHVSGAVDSILCCKTAGMRRRL